MMTFIQRYTDNLKVDLRLGIDKSVGQTGLMINDILAKSHGEVARDLCDPRQWYHSSTHRDLLASLKGELPSTGELPTTGKYIMPLMPSPNRAKRKILPTNRHGYHQFRVKQKHEKQQNSRKRTVSSPSGRGDYAMPNTTPEQLVQVPQFFVSDADESNPIIEDSSPITDKMTPSVSQSPVRIPSAYKTYNADLRVTDNATVTSVQMREFLDDIVTTDRTGKRSVDIGEGFILPSIPAVRGDFLPHVERTKQQIVVGPNGSSEKQLPGIDTRNDKSDDEQGYIAALAPRGYKKSDDSKKKVVAISVKDDRNETVLKPRVGNSDYIDNWITTLKTQPNKNLKAGPKPFIPRKLNSKRALSSRYVTTRQRKSDPFSIGNSKGDGQDTSDKTIRIPSANEIRMPSAKAIRIPSANEAVPEGLHNKHSHQKHQRNDNKHIVKLVKPSTSVKTFAAVDDNLFKKHIATTEVKLNGIETKIDDLFNRNAYLRKTVTRQPIDRSVTEKLNKSDTEDQSISVKDNKTPDTPETKADVLVDTSEHLNEPPRAASVVSIEFGGGDKHSKSKDNEKSMVVFRGCAFKAALPYKSKDPSKLVPKYRIGGKSNPRPVPSKTPPRVRVTSVEVVSEYKTRAHYLAPTNKSHDSNKDYDNYSRKQRSTGDDMTASQAFIEFGIQPANDSDMISTQNTEMWNSNDIPSCYSNLSERGYFADLDSESSDPEILSDS